MGLLQNNHFPSQGAVMPVPDLARFLLTKELKLIATKRFRNGYLWVVEKARQKIEVCPKCATPCTVRAGKAISVVRDECIRSQPIWLQIHKHRYYCHTCKKRFTESVSGIWPRRRTTQRFRNSVAERCHKATSLLSVQRDLRLSTGFIYHVFYERLEVKLNERKGAPWPKVLGIDEHFFRRTEGFTQFVTVFCDLGKNKLFEMALGKDTRSVMEQVAQIPGREHVRVVVMDLSNGYRSLVQKLFPNAQIVGDKFHVVRLFSPLIMKVGKDLFGHRQQLFWRRLLLKNRAKLNYDTRFEIDRRLVPYPVLREIYGWKNRIDGFYRIRGFQRARKTFPKILEQMKLSNLQQIRRLAQTLKRWQNAILLHFEQKLTNAATEAINNLAKIVQRRAFGYKSFRNYRIRTLSACLVRSF